MARRAAVLALGVGLAACGPGKAVLTVNLQGFGEASCSSITVTALTLKVDGVEAMVTRDWPVIVGGPPTPAILRLPKEHTGDVVVEAQCGSTTLPLRATVRIAPSEKREVTLAVDVARCCRAMGDMRQAAFEMGMPDMLPPDGFEMGMPDIPPPDGFEMGMPDIPPATFEMGMPDIPPPDGFEMGMPDTLPPDGFEMGMPDMLPAPVSCRYDDNASLFDGVCQFDI